MIGPLYKFDKLVRDFKFKEGRAAETSGGLLISLQKEKTDGFLNDFKAITGQEAWIVGEVKKGENRAIIHDNLSIIEI